MLLFREKDESALAWGQTRWKWHDQTGSLAYSLVLYFSSFIYTKTLGHSCTGQGPSCTHELSWEPEHQVWRLTAIAPGSCTQTSDVLSGALLAPGRDRPRLEHFRASYLRHLVAVFFLGMTAVFLRYTIHGWIYFLYFITKQANKKTTYSFVLISLFAYAVLYLNSSCLLSSFSILSRSLML